MRANYDPDYMDQIKARTLVFILSKMGNNTVLSGGVTSLVF